MSLKETSNETQKIYKGSILLFSVHPVYQNIIFVLSKMNQELRWVKKKNYEKMVVSDLGGRKDKTDFDIEFTAAREFYEESFNLNITNKKHQTIIDIYSLLKQKKYFARVDNEYNNRTYSTFLIEIPFEAKISCTFLLKRNKLLKIIKKRNKKLTEKRFLNNHQFVKQNNNDNKYYLKDAYNEVQDLIYVNIYHLAKILNDNHEQYMFLRTQKQRLNDIFPIFIALQNELDFTLNTSIVNSRSF